MENNFSYQAAIEELENIQAALENQEVSLDELSDKVKRAYELVKLCQERLKHTSEQIEGIIGEEGSA